MKNSPTVFFHGDLDGIVSYLVVCWAFQQKLPFIPTTPGKLSDDYDAFVAKGSTGSVIFVDLDVSKIGEKIDNATTLIFDHHKTNIYKFTKAKAFIQEETSCAKLLYQTLFKNKGQSLTDARAILVKLADDWDSHTKASPFSEELNIVFHNTQNKYTSFIEDYYGGFKPFDKFKQNTIALYKKHRDEYLAKLSPFVGEIEFEGVPLNVGAVFADNYIQECCDYLFEKLGVDVSIAVMVGRQRIAVRRSKTATVDVSKFVQRVASGGGHEAAAGGQLTDEFIEFTKLLKPAE